jgi:hypothetical protein
MKRAALFALLIVFASCFIPGFAQQVQQASSGSQNLWCDLTGTWYGGGDTTVPYHATFQPFGMGYTARFQQAIDYPAYNIKTATDWTGVVTMGFGPPRYQMSIIGYFIGMDGTLEMDAVRGTFQFSQDCNTFQHTIDTYIVYVPWTEAKKPFVTTPDVNVLEYIGMATILETYHRVPVACPKCPFPGVSTPATPAAVPNGVAARLKKK